jgi:tetratricopeptide (TPR) repeat protein
MERHFNTEELKAFASGELPKEKARALVAHLLRGCQSCRRAGSSALWRSREAVPENAYDSAFSRILATVRGETSPAHAGEGPEPVEALLDRAWDLRHEDPAEMRRITRQAVLRASVLSIGAQDRPEAADLQCKAWAAYGNACRVAGDLDEAQEALDKAAGFHAQGSGNPLVQARLYEFQASLESARRDYDRALTALDAAYAIYAGQGERHMAGRALISKGLHAGYAGRSREAFRFTQNGLAMVDEARDPGLVLSAIHNQLWFLLESGRAREARTLLRLHRDRLATGETQRLDLLWLDGRIQAALGSEEGALADLQAVEAEFLATGRRAKAASVKLDQAALHLALGDGARALALIRTAEETLKEVGTSTDVLMALDFLRRTLAQREVSAQYVLRLANVVRRDQREA